MPELNLDKISKTKALLLGAGTLGCNVARLLLGWGLKKMTLVDSGKISMSNPARQSLFTFQDSLGGENKAKVAARNLSSIYPSIVRK